MEKKIIVGLIGVVIVALAVVSLKVVEVQSEAKEENVALALANEEQQEETPVVQDVPETTIATAVVEDVVPEENAPKRMMRSISKMMDNPAMNKMVVASQRGVLDVMYADLLGQLQLTVDEKEYFMDLLLARQMNMVDLSMKMMGGNLTPEEKEALSAEMKEKNKKLKEEMEYFLNSEDDVAELEFYEKTLQDRMMLSQMEQSLAESGEALTDQSYRQLLEAIHEEKSQFNFTSDLADESNMDMSAERFSAENIENFGNDLTALNETIIERARAILTPAQLELLIKSLSDTLEMQKAQLQMAAQMFGAKQ